MRIAWDHRMKGSPYCCWTWCASSCMSRYITAMANKSFACCLTDCINIHSTHLSNVTIMILCDANQLQQCVLMALRLYALTITLLGMNVAVGISPGHRYLYLSTQLNAISMWKVMMFLCCRRCHYAWNVWHILRICNWLVYVLNEIQLRWYWINEYISQKLGWN